MNRRRFILAASAAAALAGHRTFAQRVSNTETILTSELTRGQVDLSGTSLELKNQHIDSADGSEHIHFTMENDGQFDIYFWPHTSGDSRAYIEWYSDTFMSVAQGSEPLAKDHFEDGGYIAFKAFKIGYYEYQRDAYPGHDMLALLYTDAELFEENFAEAQAILIDGMAPFLFHVDADILTIADRQIDSTESASTSRTTRGSNARSGESPASNDSDISEGNSAGSEVDAVIALRDEFWTSYYEMFALLQTVNEDGVSQKEVNDSWASMSDLAAVWKTYPTLAADITIPAGLARLESAFTNWANSVGVLGTTFDDVVAAVVTIDDFAEAHDAVLTYDEILGDELNALDASMHG